MATNALNPLNDLVRTAPMETVDDTTGVITPLTTGTVIGFLATTDDPTATAADPSLQCNGVYVGGANGYEDGTWLFKIDASVLQPALLDALFAQATPFFIVQRTYSIREVEKLRYVRSRRATIV